MNQCRALRRARQELGAAAVEFALVSGLLLLLVFGIVDMGWLVNRNTMISNASREGAREAALDPDPVVVKDTVMSFLANLDDVSPDDVVLTCEKALGGTCTPGSTGADAPVSGDIAIVTVGYTHSWLTPVMSVFFGSDVDLTRRTEMRIE